MKTKHKYDQRTKKGWLKFHDYNKRGKMVLSFPTMKRLHNWALNYRAKRVPHFDRERMSFLTDYLTYCEGNESADQYHVWAAYVTLSAAISRRVWLPNGKYTINPNIYVMLVGSAGAAKSAAIRPCKTLLSALGKVPISVAVETVEGMLKYMGGVPPLDGKAGIPYEFMFACRGPDGNIRDVNPMTIIAYEYVDFISKNPEGWTNLLNNIWDGDDYGYRTKHFGTDYLKNPYMVLFGALTTEVSTELHQMKIISTGLARRTIFQWGQRKFDQPQAIPTLTDTQSDAFARCLLHLQRIQQLNGPFTWGSGTLDYYIQWYDENSRSVLDKPKTVQSWYASRADVVMKLGMLTALSEGCDLILKPQHLELAVNFLSVMEVDLPKVFGGVGRNELAAVAMEILQFLQRLSEPIPMLRLKTQFFHQCKPPHDYDAILAHLVESGECERFTGVLPRQQHMTDLFGTVACITEFRTRAALGGAEVLAPLPRTTGTGLPSGPPFEAGPSV